MNYIENMLMEQLSGGGLSKLSNQIGADPQQTSAGLSAAVPMLISALHHNASQPQGAQDLHQALANDHGGQLLDNLDGYLNQPQTGNGSGILQHVFGGQTDTAAQVLSRVSGLDSGKSHQILQIIAPMIMAYLGRQQRQQGLSPSGLAGLLGQQQQQAQQQSPDVANMVGQLLGGGGGSEVGNILGGLLGGR